MAGNNSIMVDRNRNHFELNQNPMQNTYYSFKNFKNIELKESKNSRTALGTEPDLHFEEEFKYEDNSSIL
jgi:hypothetical protein